MVAISGGEDATPYRVVFVKPEDGRVNVLPEPA
jgi:hypothetical protein